MSAKVFKNVAEEAVHDFLEKIGDDLLPPLTRAEKRQLAREIISKLVDGHPYQFAVGTAVAHLQPRYLAWKESRNGK